MWLVSPPPSGFLRLLWVFPKHPARILSPGRSSINYSLHFKTRLHRSHFLSFWSCVSACCCYLGFCCLFVCSFLFLLFKIIFRIYILSIQDHFFIPMEFKSLIWKCKYISSPLGLPMTNLWMPQNSHYSEMPPRISSFIRNFTLEFHVGGIIQNRWSSAYNG